MFTEILKLKLEDSADSKREISVNTILNELELKKIDVSPRIFIVPLAAGGRQDDRVSITAKYK